MIGLWINFKVTSKISNWTTIFKFAENELIPGTALMIYGRGSDGNTRLLQIGNNYVRNYGDLSVGDLYSFYATYIT